MKKLLEFTWDSFFCSVHYVCSVDTYMTLYRYFMVYYDGKSLRFELRKPDKKASEN